MYNDQMKNDNIYVYLCEKFWFSIDGHNRKDSVIYILGTKKKLL